MAKYDVTYNCKHEATVELYGRVRDRMDKINWMERTLCPDCYAREQAQKENEGMQIKEVKMHYSEYKKNYAKCKSLPSTYNKYSKTIIVLVPVAEDEEAETVETLTIEDITKNK